MAIGDIQVVLFLVCFAVLPDRDASVRAVMDDAAACVAAVDIDQARTCTCFIGPKCREGIGDG